MSTINGSENNGTPRNDCAAGVAGAAGDDGTNTNEGGNGGDTLCAGNGSDTFVIRDGHGSDTITGFTPAEDVIVFDMAEISSYRDVRDRMQTVGNSTIITFDNGETLLLDNIQSNRLSASSFSFSTGPVCLHEGTLIFTERGEIAIENLRPDDIIWTKDNGWQAIRLVTFERMVFRHRDDPAKPILIPAGALGRGTPHCDLVTSPQHRILQLSDDTAEEVLVPAVKLIGINGIRRMRGRKKAHYLNIVMQRHSIIQASGCWVESMLVTSSVLSRQSAAARRMLDTCRGMKAAQRVERKGIRFRRLRSA